MKLDPDTYKLLLVLSARSFDVVMSIVIAMKLPFSEALAYWSVHLKFGSIFVTWNVTQVLPSAPVMEATSPTFLDKFPRALVDGVGVLGAVADVGAGAGGFAVS